MIRVIGWLVLLAALGGCGHAVQMPQRAHTALVDYFDAYARQRSPIAERIPDDVREFDDRRRQQATPPPVRIEIPAIDVASDLDRVDVGEDGAIAAPAEWDVPAWYRGGVRPGQRGPAVILGHVDSTSGPAVFFRLGELVPGDEIRVVRDDGSVARFAVRRSGRYDKARFPTNDVYLPTPDATLRLITCAGTFDRETGHYRDNLVVFADPLR